MQSRLTGAAFALASTLALVPTLASATLPDTYNAVRCRRPQETSTAVHVAIFKGQPMGMYWIENDRVEVLSSEIEEKNSVVTAWEYGREQRTFILNYANGNFKVFDRNGKLSREENLACELCPANMDHCPGDEPGNGTNIPPKHP